MIKTIFFDFDGVILDSMNCKTDAFYKLYIGYGTKIANEVKDYHIKNGGVSRYEKFKYWEKKYFNRSLDDNELDVLSKKFSNLVVDNVINSNKIEGVIEFLKLNYKKYNFFIITGTPTNEILHITKKIKIFRYFKDIKGSPEKKTHWINYYINKYNLNKSEIIFIGDTETDYIASMQNNLHFALRTASYNQEYFNKKNVFKFENYNELEGYIKIFNN